MNILNVLPRFLANSFLGLNYVFSVQAWYICLNSIDFSKQKYISFIDETEFNAEKLFARNLGMQFRRAVHIPGGL